MHILFKKCFGTFYFIFILVHKNNVLYIDKRKLLFPKCISSSILIKIRQIRCIQVISAFSIKSIINYETASLAHITLQSCKMIVKRGMILCQAYFLLDMTVMV